MRPASHIRFFMSGLALLLLSSCASTPPLPSKGLNLSLQPADIVRASEQGKTPDDSVLWGGLIVESRNLADHTQLEILAYPLDEDQFPDTNAAPLGRFLANHKGYLEPLEYSAGRRVTLSGQITGTQKGQIQSATQVYPTLRVRKIQLWSTTHEQNGSNVRFGIGIGMIFR